MTDLQDIPEDEALAAEYVLGLLDADEVRQFEARLDLEPSLRAYVHFYEAQFADLAIDLPELQPSATTKARIMSIIAGRSESAPSLWSRLFGFGWFAIPAVLAVVAFFVVTPILRGPSFDPTLHATLISESGDLHIEAGYSPNGSLFKVIPEVGAPEAGRDFELWVISENAPAPVSLGVIQSDREQTFEITDEIAALIEGGVLAVSDEPEGGSPTGAPTGDVLAVGAFFDV